MNSAAHAVTVESIQIKVAPPGSEITVRAIRIDSMAIHKTRIADSWTVTHVPSGLVTAYRKTWDEAFDTARELLALNADWTITTQQQLEATWPEEMRAKARALAQLCDQQGDPR